MSDMYRTEYCYKRMNACQVCGLDTRACSSQKSFVDDDRLLLYVYVCINVCVRSIRYSRDVYGDVYFCVPVHRCYCKGEGVTGVHLEFSSANGQTLKAIGAIEFSEVVGFRSVHKGRKGEILGSEKSKRSK